MKTRKWICVCFLFHMQHCTFFNWNIALSCPIHSAERKSRPLSPLTRIPEIKKKKNYFSIRRKYEFCWGNFLSYSSQRRAGITTRRLAWRIPQSFEICWRTTRAPRVKRHSRISRSSATRFLRGSTDSREEALGHARARFLHVLVHFLFKEVFKQTNEDFSLFHGTLGCGNNLLMKMSLFLKQLYKLVP